MRCAQALSWRPRWWKVGILIRLEALPSFVEGENGPIAYITHFCHVADKQDVLDCRVSSPAYVTTFRVVLCASHGDGMGVLITFEKPSTRQFQSSGLTSFDIWPTCARLRLPAHATTGLSPKLSWIRVRSLLTKCLADACSRRMRRDPLSQARLEMRRDS